MYMKEIKLEAMHIERFKGLFAFDIQFGEHTEVSGRNALGKTCIYDAYLWCLFNKDSRGRVIDKVQYMDADGVADKDARTIVAVSFSIDGQKVVFRREFYQSWSKKRGTTEYVFNGNASDYYYNDVPLSLTEFNKKIVEYFDKDKFELVSNINLFASFDVARRRSILEEIADVQSLSKLIAAEYPTVAKASAEGKSVDELTAELRKRALRVKDDAEDIPVRIDEIERSIPDAPDYAYLREQKSKLTDLQEARQKKIDDYKQAALLGASTELRKELNGIVDKIAGLTREATLAANKERNEANDNINVHKVELMGVKRRQAMLDASANEAMTKCETLRSKFDGYKADWEALNELEYKPNEEPLTQCPTCGHVFTAEELAENSDRALQIFNRDKLDKLAKIESDAKSTKEQLDLASDAYRKAKEAAEKNAEEVAKLEKVVDDAAKHPVVVKTAEERLAVNPEFQQLSARRDELEKKLSEDKPQTYDEEIKAEKDAMLGTAAEIADINRELAKEEQIANARKRIEELNEQGRALGQERADIEKMLDELAAFSKRKVNAIEDRINGLFQYVKIRMFEPNLTNDGVKDVCDITVDGIPYSVLNTASRINAGIDICRTLALAYGMKAPIWVDNAESVNRILGGDCQLVTLRVTEEANLTTQIV